MKIFLALMTGWIGILCLAFSAIASNPHLTVIFENEKKPVPNFDHFLQLLGTKKCSGCDLRGADLRSRDLRGADLRNALLGEANFDRANLEGADFRQSKLFNDYTEVDFSKLTVFGATDSYSFYVTHQIIPEASLGVLITEENRDSYKNSRTVPIGASFREANLTGANFSGTLLRGLVFRNANLSKTDFSAVDFYSNLDFLGANFQGANLKDAKFSRYSGFTMDIDVRNVICPNGKVLTGDIFHQRCFY